MRIVHYAQHALSGETGSANSVRGWCEALQRQGMEVVCAVDSNQMRIDPPEGPRFLPLPHRLSGRLRYPLGLRTLLVDADVFVLHGGWLPSNNLASLLARKARIPYLVTTHGVYFSKVLQRNRALKWAWRTAIERPHLERALALHLLFPEESDGLRRMGVSASTILAPNGITPPEGIFWDGGSGGYLLWMGRFDPVHKGLDMLLRALGTLPEHNRPIVRLHGPDWKGQRAVVAQMVDEMALNRWVSVEPPVYGPSKWELLARARGFVYPSRWEASPMAVAEAISIGVPSLVTPYPMGRFVASQGGALLSDGNAEQIGAGILRLMEEGSRLSTRGAEVAREHFSWDTVSRSWIKQVKELIEDSRKY